MKTRWSKYLSRVAIHVAGVSSVVAVVLAMNTNADVAQAFWLALDEPTFYRLVTLPILTLVGVSACLWVMFYASGVWAIEARREKRQLAVVRTRGAIMTEFLIVLPIYLLLTSGLAQLSINSTAKVLTSLAAFQAGRTAWLWEAETRSGNVRNGATKADGVERARIAAASVLAPVVPAEFRGTCSYTATFDEVSRALTLAPASAARALATGQTDASPKNRFYNVAFDDSIMLERGAKKLFLAYCHTSVDYSGGGRGIKTNVTYNHLNAFPWFAYIFGKPKISAGHFAFYSEMRAEYSLPAQIPANPRSAMSLRATFNGFMSKLGL